MTTKMNFTTGSYNASDLVNQFGALFGDCVCTGLAVAAHSPANLSVDVSAGSCMKNGLFLNSDAAINLTIAANTSGYNRIDIIVADVSDGSFKVVQGTAASSPTAPLPTANQLVIAEISVGNNVSVINTASITDKRPPSYIKIGPLVVQIATVTIPNFSYSGSYYYASQAVTFPKAFPNNLLFCTAMFQSYQSWACGYSGGSKTGATFQVRNTDGSANNSMTYIAVGW